MITLNCNLLIAFVLFDTKAHGTEVPQCTILKPKSYACCCCQSALQVLRRAQPLHIAALLLQRATCRAMQGMLEGAVADCGAVLALAAPLLAGKVLASQ